MDKIVPHGDRDHALYAPSSMSRTLHCHGSIAAQEGIPDRKNVYSEEGTECHEVAGAILEGAPYSRATADLTDDQEEIVGIYTDYVFDLIDRMISKHGKENVEVWVETRVRSREKGFENNHGTADFAIYVKPLRTLAVVDLKAGFVPVDVGTPDIPNAQLANYGFLALDHHSLWDKVDKVRLTIVQPRCYDKPQTVTMTTAQLEEFADRVGGAIRAIERGDLSRNAGSWCKYCKAAGRCPTKRAHAREGARMIFDAADQLQAPRNYEVEDLAEILAEAEQIQVHLDGVMAHVIRELERGRFKGHGWKLVAKRATAKWLDAPALLSELEGISADHLATKPKMLTPLQLEKALAAEGIEFDLTDYFVKESSGFNLARESDPRPGITPDPFKD